MPIMQWISAPAIPKTKLISGSALLEAVAAEVNVLAERVPLSMTAACPNNSIFV